MSILALAQTHITHATVDTAGQTEQNLRLLRRARVRESAGVQCRSEVEAEVSDGSDEEYRPGQVDRKNLAKYSKRTKPRK
jgi:hypothetical protein